MRGGRKPLVLDDWVEPEYELTRIDKNQNCSVIQGMVRKYWKEICIWDEALLQKSQAEDGNRYMFVARTRQSTTIRLKRMTTNGDLYDGRVKRIPKGAPVFMAKIRPIGTNDDNLKVWEIEYLCSAHRYATRGMVELKFRLKYAYSVDALVLGSIKASVLWWRGNGFKSSYPVTKGDGRLSSRTNRLVPGEKPPKGVQPIIHHLWTVAYRIPARLFGMTYIFSKKENNRMRKFKQRQKKTISTIAGQLDDISILMSGWMTRREKKQLISSRRLKQALLRKWTTPTVGLFRLAESDVISPWL